MGVTKKRTQFCVAFGAAVWPYKRSHFIQTKKKSKIGDRANEPNGQ